jgi:hypothetical protein
MSASELLRRQSLVNAKIEEKAYQVTRLERDPQDRPEIICFTSKTSAQRLIADLAGQQGPDRYRVTCFSHPVLPGFGMEK